MDHHDDTWQQKGLASFMATRCDVSSQHKLPTLDEILSTYTAAVIGYESCRDIIHEWVATGRLISYGPYLSDHAIEVL